MTSRRSTYNDLAKPKTDSTNKKKLIAFYRVYNPDKVNNLDNILEKWSGRESQLFRRLVNKYKANPAVLSLGRKSPNVGAAINSQFSFGLSMKPSGFGSVESAPTNSVLPFGKACSRFTGLQNMSTPTFSSLASAAPTTHIFGSLSTLGANAINFRSMSMSKSTTENAEGCGKKSGMRTRSSFKREDGMDCD